AKGPAPTSFRGSNRPGGGQGPAADRPGGLADVEGGGRRGNPAPPARHRVRMAGMAAPSALLDYLEDQLASLGQLRGRAMFGCHGLYLDGLFIGIIDDETPYLKADDVKRPAFGAAGIEALPPSRPGLRVS